MTGADTHSEVTLVWEEGFQWILANSSSSFFFFNVELGKKKVVK